MDRLYFIDLNASAGEPSGLGTAGRADELMLGSLPREKREKLLRFRQALDRKIGIYAQVLLRCLISAELGINFGEVDIRSGPWGKPYVQDAPWLQFNLSHTRSAVAVVLSGEPVGVDVEREREISPDLAQSVFSDNERALLGGTPEDHRRVFLELWTKKEARLKRRGTGLAGNLKECDVTLAEPDGALSTLQCGAYIVSVCASTAFDKANMTIMTCTDLADMWRRAVNALFF